MYISRPIVSNTIADAKYNEINEYGPTIKKHNPTSNKI